MSDVTRILSTIEQGDPSAAAQLLIMSEAAESLGLSVRSAHDVRAYARSWLHRQLRPD
jgi:hypothetical protein